MNLCFGSLLGLVVAVVAICPSLAQAEGANPPTFHRGFRISFRSHDPRIDKWTLIYLGRRNDSHIFERKNSDGSGAILIFSTNMSLRSILRKNKVETRYKPDNGYLRFPLRVGAIWKERCYRHQIGVRSGMDVSGHVVAIEHLQFAGRMLRTIRVAIHVQPISTKRAAFRETCWYAPSLGFFVRCRGSAKYSGFEMIAVSGVQ
jgi:hypothetical protein